MNSSDLEGNQNYQITTNLIISGDLSGKYGKILVFDESGVNISTTDWNLPLFGINSVVGRSVVITGENSDRKYVNFEIDKVSLETKTFVALSN